MRTNVLQLQIMNSEDKGAQYTPHHFQVTLQQIDTKGLPKLNMRQ
jgi:hypothetical protein